MTSLATRRFVLPIAAGVALTMAACSSTTSPAASDSTESAPAADPLTVMTAFYPLQYLTEHIGGDLVSVSLLTPPGGEAHDLELTPAKVEELRNSDAVVYLKGFQSAVDEAVEAAPPSHVVDVSEAAQLVERTETTDVAHDAETTETHDHATETSHAHDHAAETTTSETATTHDDHDHATAGDPHFWLDPTRMGQVATVIGQALAAADPVNAQTYTTNAGSVKKQMDELSASLVQGTATCTHKTFVTSHTAFGYLADRTGLEQVGISGLDPDSSPSPARLQEIANLVKAEGITTIFTEALIDPKVAQTLASDLGITTAVLDPLESQNDDSKDYVAVMKENLAALRTALDCQ
ncbi:metal ABC transporter substrate-binding protein [Schaalia suimastitidis]|uniref:metal ABC transporter substrate-binding protein n=1 Tax=Schaalia suimastitidis TaxID=121163 RepID=UPI0005545753|nr:metal ABC transporter substrate-binding protein [Schaalia suimastitidis]